MVFFVQYIFMAVYSNICINLVDNILPTGTTYNSKVKKNPIFQFFLQDLDQIQKSNFYMLFA